MKRPALASLFALALAGAAHADSVVGGGSATITGGGDNAQITYATGGAGGGPPPPSDPGRLARPTRTPSGTGVEYMEPAPSDPGRAARLLGRGDTD